MNPFLWSVLLALIEHVGAQNPATFGVAVNPKLGNRGELWTEGLIPFVIDDKFFNSQVIRYVREAMNSWERETCIRFVPYIDQADYILITSSTTGCWSYIGRQAGRQLILLNEHCATAEVISYELGHAIGIYIPVPEEDEIEEDSNTPVHSTMLHFDSVSHMFGVNMDKSLLQAFTPHLQALEIANDLYECEGTTPTPDIENSELSYGITNCDSVSWGDWSECSAKCGPSITRVRVKSEDCGNPQKEACPNIQCPGIEQECYSPWSSWAVCNARCGEGHQHRTRDVLTNTDHNGVACYDGEDYLFEKRKCPDLAPCEVDCKVGEWTNWEACSRECFPGGESRRFRPVLASPKHGGAECPALYESKECGKVPCPDPRTCTVTGWSEWTGCSSECGGGKRVRFRSVLRAPTMANVQCPHLEEDQNCHTQPCPEITINSDNSPVDCEVTKWSDWSLCSTTCGTGVQHRFRVIVKKQRNGGKNCDSLEENKPCDAGFCYGSCGLTGWTEWSACSKACGPGTSSRFRYIRHADNVDLCPSLTELKSCVYKDKCPEVPEKSLAQADSHYTGDDVECELSQWSTWTLCTVSCGVGGQQQRFREMIVMPRGNGKACLHQAEEQFGCNEHIECQNQIGQCHVSNWAVWSECSVSCGEGLETRSRTITSRTHNAACPILQDEKYCTRKPCTNMEGSVEGSTGCRLSEWTSWGQCDVACGRGIHTRRRQLEEGQAEDCPSTEESQLCEMPECSGNMGISSSNGLLGEESFVMWSPKLDKCVSIFEDAGNTIALMVECDEKEKNQNWRYTSQHGLYNANNKKCLDYRPQVTSPHVIDHNNFYEVDCSTTTSQYICMENSVTVRVPNIDIDLCLGHLTIEDDNMAVTILGIEKCGATKHQVLETYKDRTPVCSKSARRTRSPLPGPQPGCTWVKGPVIQCPQQHVLRGMQLDDEAEDVLFGECCEDKTVSNKCKMYPVSTSGNECVHSVLTGATFIDGIQRHIKCCDNSKKLKDCVTVKKSLEAAVRCPAYTVAKGASVNCVTGCQATLVCCAEDTPSGTPSEIVVPKGCKIVNTQHIEYLSTSAVMCPKDPAKMSILQGVYMVSDIAVGICCELRADLMPREVSFGSELRFADGGCGEGEAVEGITLVKGAITTLSCAKLSVPLSNCYTHHIPTVDHIGCPKDKFLAGITHKCKDNDCSNTVTCCEAQSEDLSPAAEMTAPEGCSVKHAVFEQATGLHSIGCKKDSYVTSIGIFGDKVEAICCPADKELTKCFLDENEGEDMFCEKNQVLQSAHLMGGYMQTTNCCEVDTESQTVESCSIVNVGMKGLLKCPDKQSITAILTKCNKDVCNKILKCCKLVQVELGVIGTIAKSLQDIVSSVIGEEKEEIGRCKDVKLGQGDFECQEPHSFLSALSTTVAECCIVEGPLAEFKSCTMQPVSGQCDERGVVTGVRFLDGLVSHMSCCCLKGDVANCALTDEWYCPEGKVLVGLDGTQANCCDVVEKKKDKCISQNTEIIGGLIKSINGAQHIGECVRLCSAVEACIGWTYLSSTAECVLVDESHERTSKLVGAVSGFLICDKDDKDDMVEQEADKDDSCVKKDIALKGGDLSISEGIDCVKTCVEMCRNTEGCIAVSYNTHDKSCALKDNSNGGEQFLSGYQSVLMSCEADIEEDEASIMPEVEDEASIMPEVEETHLRLIKPSEPSVHEIDDKCLLKNTDFPGPTLIKYKVGSAGECLEKCRRFGNQCVAFTFMAEYKTCLGKGADHGAATMTSWRARNGAVAGLVKCWDSGGNVIPVIKDKPRLCTKISTVAHQYFASDNAECPQSNHILSAIDFGSVTCCEVQGCPIIDCDDTLYSEEKRCPWGSMINAVGFIEGEISHLQCCRRECGWHKCIDRINECQPNEFMTQVLQAQCKITPCEMRVRCCVRKEGNDEDPTFRAEVAEETELALVVEGEGCRTVEYSWRQDIKSMFAQCLGKASILQSTTSDSLSCCSSKCSTVDCEVVETEEDSECPEGYVINGIGKIKDGVSFLQCCRTNCDISDSCTQRSDTCEAGELIVNAQSGDEDVTDKEGSVLLTCCKVDSYKKGKEWREEFENRGPRRKRRSVAEREEVEDGLVAALLEDGVSAALAVGEEESSQCVAVEFNSNEEIEAIFAQCLRSHDILRRVSQHEISCCSNKCRTDSCNTIDIHNKVNFACPTGTIINALGRVAETSKVSQLTCCRVDCRIGACRTSDICEADEVMTTISINNSCDRLPCPYQLTCCKIDAQNHSETNPTHPTTILQTTHKETSKPLPPTKESHIESHHSVDTIIDRIQLSSIEHETSAYKLFTIPSSRCPYMVRGRAITCPVRHELESAHIIGDKTLEGRCCKSTAAMPCAPVLHEECMGAICSAGMAGRGVFKLGCLKPRDPEEGKLCEEIELRTTDVVACPEGSTMVDISSKCPSGVHKSCVIYLKCCKKAAEGHFRIHRRTAASIKPNKLFGSMSISCLLYDSALLASITLGRVPMGSCGTTEVGSCYTHLSFDMTEGIQCDEGYGFSLVSIGQDGQTISPYTCCKIVDEPTEIALITGSRNVSCEHGFINSMKLTMTKSGVQMAITCIYSEGILKQEQIQESTKLIDELELSAEDCEESHKNELYKDACLLRDTDFPDGFLKKVPAVSNPIVCRNLCNDLAGCSAFVYTATGSCILKNTEHGLANKETFLARAGSVASEMSCSAPIDTSKSILVPTNPTISLNDHHELVAQACIEENVKFDSGVIAKVKNLKNVMQCQQTCQEQDGCEAFTYLTQKNVCKVMNEWYGPQKKYAGALSATMDCFSGGTEEADYLGYQKQKKKWKKKNKETEDKEVEIEKMKEDIKNEKKKGKREKKGKKNRKNNKEVEEKEKEVEHIKKEVKDDEEDLENELLVDSEREDEDEILADELEKAKKEKRLAEKKQRLAEKEKELAEKERQLAQKAKYDAEKKKKLAKEEKWLAQEAKKAMKKKKAAMDEERKQVEQKLILAEKEKSLAENEKKSAKEEKVRQRKAKKAAEKAIEIVDKIHELAAKERAIEIKKEELAKKDEGIAQNEKDIAEKDQDISEKDEEIADKDIEIEEKQREIERYKKEVQEKDSEVIEKEIEIEGSKNKKYQIEHAALEKCTKENTDLPGGKLDSGVLPTIEECLKSCSKTKGCVAFIWLANKSFCTLKDDTHEEENKQNYMALEGAVMGCMKCIKKEKKRDKKEMKGKKDSTEDSPKSSASLRCVSYQTNLPGGTLEVVKDVKNIKRCVKVCLGNEKCHAVTFFIQSKACKLKHNSHGEAVENEKAQSVLMSCIKEEVKDDEEDLENELLVDSEREDEDEILADELEKAKKEKRLAEKKQRLAEKEKQLAEKERQLAQKAKYDAEKQKKLAKEEKWLAQEAKKAMKKKKAAMDEERKQVEQKLILAEKEKILAENEKKLAKEEKVRQRKEKKAAEKAIEIVDKIHELAAKERAIEIKKEELAKKDEGIAQNEKDIAEKDQDISEKAEEIADKDIEIEEKQKEIERYKKEVQEKDSEVIEKEIEIEGSKNKKYQIERAALEKCTKENTDLPGGKLDSGVLPTIEECLKSCSKTKGCVAFIWLAKKSFCTLKDDTHEEENKQNYMALEGAVMGCMKCIKKEKKRNKKEMKGKKDSAEDSPKSSDSCVSNLTFLAETNFPGGTLEVVKDVKNIKTCVKLCLGNEKCRAVTFYIQSKACKLKDDSHGEAVENEKTQSVLMTCEKMRTSNDEDSTESGDNCVINNTDLPGGTQETVRDVKNLKKCVKMCLDNEKCQAVSFCKQSKNCELKDGSHRQGVMKEKTKSVFMSCEREKQEDDEDSTEDSPKSSDSCVLSQTNLPGRTLEVIKDVKNIKTCVKVCLGNEKCHAVTFCTQSKACKLKDDSHGEAVEKKKTQSVLMSCERDDDEHSADSRNSCIMNKTKLPGGTHEIIRDLQNIKKCVKKCLETEKCHAVSYFKKSDVCELKDEFHGEGFMMEKTQSVLMTCEKMRTSNDEDSTESGDNCVINNTDLPGGTQETVRDVKNLKKCVKMCLDNEKCQAVSFCKQSKNCELKDGSHRQGVMKEKTKSVFMSCEREKQENDEDSTEDSPKSSDSCVLSQTNLPGGTLEVMKDVKNIKKCVKVCLGNEKCHAVSYFKKSDVCELKDEFHGEGFMMEKRQSVLMTCEKMRTSNDEDSTESGDNCVINNTDLPGGTQETVKGVKNLKKCAKMCLDNEKCQAVSFCKQSKNCELKDGSHGQGVMKENTKSVFMSCEREKEEDDEDSTEDSPKSSDSCVLSQTNLPGGTLEVMKDVKNIKTCVKVCLGNEKCHAVSYFKKSDVCELKDEFHGEGFMMEKTQSVLMTCEKMRTSNDEDSTESGDNCVINNTDLPGGTQETVKEVKNLKKCVKMCLDNEKCQAVSFCKQSKNCELKDGSHGQGVMKEKTKSVFMSCEREKEEDDEDSTDDKRGGSTETAYNIASAKDCVQEGVNFNGGTIERIEDVKSVKSCTKKCKKTTGCTAVSYNKAFKQCRLKNGIHAPGSEKQGIESVLLTCLHDVKLPTDEGQKESKEGDNAPMSTKDCIRKDLGIQGKDISVERNIANMAACIFLCLDSEQCAVVVYQKKEKSCTLKDNYQTKVETLKDGAKGALKSCLEMLPIDGEAVNFKDCVQKDVDIIGKAVDTVYDVKKMGRCIKVCQDSPECTAVSYDRKEKKCTTKVESDGSGVVVKGVMSASMSCFDEDDEDETDVQEVDMKSADDLLRKGNCLMENMVLPNGDLIRRKIFSITECYIACRDTEGCEAFTYNQKRHLCDLKTSGHEEAIKNDKPMSKPVSAFLRCLVKEEITDDEGGDHKLPHNTLVNKITEEVVDEDGTVHDNSAEGCLRHNTDLPGGIIQKITGIADVNNCIRLCQDLEGCTAITLLTMLQICSLKDKTHDKSTTENLAAKDGAISVRMSCIKTNRGNKKRDGKRIKGLKVSKDTEKHEMTEEIIEETDQDVPCSYKDAEYPGTSIKIKSIPTIKKCSKLCRKTEGCATWTWIEMPGKKAKCFLRGADHGELTREGYLATNGATTGLLKCVKEDEKAENEAFEKKKVAKKEMKRKEMIRQEREKKPRERKKTERQEVEMQEIDKQERGRKERKNKEMETKEMERQEMENQEMESQERERQEMERQDMEKQEMESKEREKHEMESKERKERKRKERERKEIERQDMERQERERQEMEKHEIENEERKEMKRKEKERKEMERQEMEKHEMERNERKEMKRKERERKEMERKEKGRQDVENMSVTEENRNCLQEGTDLPSGTIGAVKLPTIESCRFECSKTSGCVAVVFLDDTCRLKDESHGPPNKESGKAQRGAVSLEMSCGGAEKKSDNQLKPSHSVKKTDCFMEGTDLPSGTILAVKLPTIKSCRVECSKTSGCVAVVFVDETCRLKDESHGPPNKESEKAQRGAVSSEMSCGGAELKSDNQLEPLYSAKTTDCFMEGTDLPSGTIGTVKLPTIESCRVECSKTSGCVAVVFLDDTCRLKDESHGPPNKESGKAQRGAVSSQMSCSGAKQKSDNELKPSYSSEKTDCFMEGTDLPSGTILAVKLPTIERCRVECSKTSGCVAFVFLDDTCRLKDESHGPADKSTKNAHQGAVASKMNCGKPMKAEKTSDKQAKAIKKGTSSTPTVSKDLTGCLMEGTDLPSGTIKTVMLSTIESCRVECSKTRGCIAVVFLDDTCRLKDESHGPANKESGKAQRGAVSLEMSCCGAEKKSDNQPKPYSSGITDCFMEGTDLPSGTIGAVKLPTIERCRVECSKTSGCVAVVFLDDTCRLKDESHGPPNKESGKAQRGAVSSQMSCGVAERRKEDESEKDNRRSRKGGRG